jgi:hypothetical protein
MKNKNTGDLDLARRIRAAGSTIHIAEDDDPSPSIPSDRLLVRQTGGQMESCAIECSGGTAYIINLVITSKLASFAISAFGLQTAWPQEYFRWLEDPLMIDGHSPRYRFGVREVQEFEREHVINHCADVRQILPVGHSVSGFLLGIGYESIPEQFRHGTMIPAFVLIYDQFGRKHRSAVELEAVRNLARPRVPRRSTLLDRPDSIEGRSHS